MKELILLLSLVFACAFISACGNTYSPSTTTIGVPGPSSPSSQAPIAAVSPTPTPSPAASGAVADTSVLLTVYTQTKTVTQNGRNMQVTGYCTMIQNGSIYCWDDGIHKVFASGLLVAQGTYFGYYFQNGQNVDVFASPQQVTGSYLSNMPIGSGGHADVTDMFAHGTQSQVSCTAELDCGSFHL